LSRPRKRSEKGQNPDIRERLGVLHDARAGVIHRGTAVSNAKKGLPLSLRGPSPRPTQYSADLDRQVIADQAEHQEEDYLEAILFERVSFGPGMLINLDVRDGSKAEELKLSISSPVLSQKRTCPTHSMLSLHAKIIALRVIAKRHFISSVGRVIHQAVGLQFVRFFHPLDWLVPTFNEGRYEIP